MKRNRIAMMTIALGLLATLSLRAAKASAFDLAGPTDELVRGAWIQGRKHVLQSFDFDDADGTIYVLQVEGSDGDGSFRQHSRRGDLVLTKLSPEGGSVLGHMKLRGFGHGVAMGVEREGEDVFVWTEIDSVPNPSGVGRGTRIGRFRFEDGADLESGSPKVEAFQPIAGAYNCTPSVDATSGVLAMRYVSAAGKWRVAAFDLERLKRGETKPLRDIALPFDIGTAQGWCSYGDRIYLYSGNAYGKGNPPPGNARIWAVDWNSGEMKQSAPTGAFGELEFREPEGIAVREWGGTPRLCFGFGASVSAKDKRRTVNIAAISTLK